MFRVPLDRSGSIERRRGAYRLLEAAGPYALLQRALGARQIHRALSERFLDPFPGMRVLDVGAGTAALLPVLGDCRYTALEPNRGYVAQIRARPDSALAAVFCGSTRALPELEGPFDRILFMALLHHLDDETASSALRDAAGLLAPGGRVVTMDNCFHDGQHWMARRLAAMDRGGNVRPVEGYAALARPYYAEVRTWLSTDLLRVPYSHVWVVSKQPK